MISLVSPSGSDTFYAIHDFPSVHHVNIEIEQDGENDEPPEEYKVRFKMHPYVTLWR